MKMRDPKLEFVGTFATARTYHFRSTERLGGWALCTVNDRTGELLIVSDWGNWSHMWSPNPSHLGKPTLTHFIADRQGYDYLANKLLGRSDCWVLDADATVAKWRKRICAARLESGQRHNQFPYSSGTALTAFQAREIWDRLGSLRDDERDESIFIEHAYQIDGFSEWISERPWEDTEHRESYEYVVLSSFILPALAKACAVTAREIDAVTPHAKGATP